MNPLKITFHEATVRYVDENDSVDVVIGVMPMWYEGDGSDLPADEDVFYWLERNESIHSSPSDDWVLINVNDTYQREYAYADWMVDKDAALDRAFALAEREFNVEHLYEDASVDYLIEALLEAHTALNVIVNHYKK